MLCGDQSVSTVIYTGQEDATTAAGDATNVTTYAYEAFSKCVYVDASTGNSSTSI
jgi:hypothetical protein